MCEVENEIWRRWYYTFNSDRFLHIKGNAMNIRTFNIAMMIMLFATSILVNSVVVAASNIASDPIGKVIIAVGDVKAMDKNKKSRSLKRGENLYLGDTVITVKKSRAQIKLTDESVYSLRPKTNMKFDTYFFNKQQPKDNDSVVDLVTGGFRSVTGLIAKTDPSKYIIKTPVAIIGVRGTSFTVVYQDKELAVSVWQGQLFLRNEGGVLVIGRELPFKHAWVTSLTTIPQGLADAAPIITQCPFTNR